VKALDNVVRVVAAFVVDREVSKLQLQPDAIQLNEAARPLPPVANAVIRRRHKGLVHKAYILDGRLFVALLLDRNCRGRSPAHAGVKSNLPGNLTLGRLFANTFGYVTGIFSFLAPAVDYVVTDSFSHLFQGSNCSRL